MQGNEKETEGKRLIINQSHPLRINMHGEGNTYIRFQIVCLLVGALTEKSLLLSPKSILIDEKTSGIKCNLCQQILSDLGPPWPPLVPLGLPWFPLGPVLLNTGWGKNCSRCIHAILHWQCLCLPNQLLDPIPINSESRNQLIHSGVFGNVRL
jgi:hypothetical protein